MKYKIYKLVHNDVAVYIGKTKLTLKKRKSAGYKKNPPVQAIHKECVIELIEETSDVSREIYWIEYYKDTLLNIRRGDAGLSQKEYKKEWEEANKELRKEQRKQRNKSNRDYRNQYMREYRLKNKKTLC
jgi:hypothetical protein